MKLLVKTNIKKKCHINKQNKNKKKKKESKISERWKHHNKERQYLNISVNIKEPKLTV
jgi:hypothetical protein